MTELKRPCVLQLRHNNSEGFVYAYEVGEMNKYLSEVDKVIAEQKADYKEACARLQTANLIKEEQLAATRHQKYKRCLNKADFCLLETAIFLNNEVRKNFYYRWYKRWLKIADKFKEAK